MYLHDRYEVSGNEITISLHKHRLECPQGTHVPVVVLMDRLHSLFKSPTKVGQEELQEEQ